MKAYSYDLRLRALRAVDQGRKRSEIVAMFAISLATLKRYLKRQRETGDVRAKSIPGRPAKKGTALQAGLLSQLDAYPDATLAEHCRIWKNTEAGAGQFYDDEPCDPTPELDAQEKDVASK
jgi:transposase